LPRLPHSIVVHDAGRPTLPCPQPRELIERLAGGKVRKALRVYNRHFHQIELSLMLDETHDKLSQMDTMLSALAM
jgi:hypothetical protein